MKMYLLFVAMTIVCWGAYVPTIHEGQTAVGGKNRALWAFLFVGAAYFLTAVLVPMGMLAARQDLGNVPNAKGWGISLLAGVLGALGALGVILALMNGGTPKEVPPLVFAGAPIVATIIGFMLHRPASAPPWQFFAGIALAAVGAGMVLRYKPDSAAGAPQSRPAASGPTTQPVVARSEWTMFRGNPRNTGTSDANLPAQLALRWKFRTDKGEPIETAPAIVAGMVYFGCDDSHLYAVDLETGRERWRFKARAEVKSSPAVAEGRVYVGDEAGVLHAVDAADGREVWSFEAGESIVSSPIPIGKRLFFGSYNGSLYCLNADDGKQLWKYDSEDKLHATPAVADDCVLISGCDARLHVVRAADGVLVRKVELGAPCGSSAAVLDSLAFAGTQGCQILGLNWKTGDRAWQFEDTEHALPFLASPSVSGDLVIIGGRDKRIRALDAKTGGVRWTVIAKGRIEGSAVVVGERVFVPGGDGVLLCLDLRTGKETWRYETGSEFGAPPAVAEGRLVVGGLDGVLYCFGPS